MLEYSLFGVIVIICKLLVGYLYYHSFAVISVKLGHFIAVFLSLPLSGIIDGHSGQRKHHAAEYRRVW